jgi:hypothetical protein
MPSQRAKRAGLILVTAGIALYGTWVLWLGTRTERPVDIPMLMAVGHVRVPEFKLNLTAPFTIMINVQKTIPFETLNCLLGTASARASTDIGDCPDRPSVVKASWVLTSDGQTVARGSSEEYRSGAWMNDSISRELGDFQGQRGRRYVLDVDVLTDGSALAPGNPRLKVEVHPMVYEGHAVLSVFFFLATGVLELTGIALLFVASRKKPRENASELT